ncbi:MAG: S8 family serine peptidase [Candidatus Competibacteraceae bacterium]
MKTSSKLPSFLVTALFSGLLSTIPAQAQAIDPDVNDDGVVNSLDSATVGKCFGASFATRPECRVADVDGDSDVDRSDLDLVAANFGKTGFFFSKEPDFNKVVSDPRGSVYPVNQLIVLLADNRTRSDANQVAASVSGTVVGDMTVARAYQLEVPASTISELDVMIDRLKSDFRVAGVTRNTKYSLSAVNTDLGHLRDSDPEKTKAYDLIKVEDAWNLIADSSVDLEDVAVSIIDSGVYVFHPEFDGIKISGVLLDLEIDGGHGTSVAGVIAANNNPSIGLPTESNGINGIFTGAFAGEPKILLESIWYAKYHYDAPMNRFLAGHPWITSVIESINKVKKDRTIKNKYEIVNMSIGVAQCDDRIKKECRLEDDFNAQEKLFREAIEKQPQTIFVVAAGNDGIFTQRVLPAGLLNPNVITVGATDYLDKRAVWNAENSSNFGKVNIAAPGVNVYAPNNSGDYATNFSGTSASAPMVTGVIALMKSIDPSLSPTDVKTILRETGDPTDDSIGGKRLNAANAVACVLVKKGVDINTALSNLPEGRGAKIQEVLDGITLCGGGNGEKTTFVTVSGKSIFEIVMRKNDGKYSFSVKNLAKYITGFYGDYVYNANYGGPIIRRISLAFDPSGNLRTAIGNIHESTFSSLASFTQDDYYGDSTGTQKIDLQTGEATDYILVRSPVYMENRSWEFWNAEAMSIAINNNGGTTVISVKTNGTYSSRCEYYKWNLWSCSFGGLTRFKSDVTNYQI